MFFFHQKYPCCAEALDEPRREVRDQLGRLGAGVELVRLLQRHLHLGLGMATWLR